MNRLLIHSEQGTPVYFVLKSNLENWLKTQDEFISDINRVHGERYDYSKAVYVNNRSKVILKCKLHGEFLIRPNSLIDSKQTIIRFIVQKFENLQNDRKKFTSVQEQREKKHRSR